jgi:hypothetical protein
MGRILRPALIPGATYRQTVSFPDVKYEFTAESGKNIDLGDLTVSDPRE